MSVYAKLATSLFVLLLLTAGFYTGVTLVTSRLYLEEVNQKLNREVAEHLVSEEILLAGGEVNQEALKHAFHMMMVVNPSIELYLLDLDGRILAFSAPPGKVRLERVSLAPIRRFLAAGAGFPILGDDPRNPGGKKAFSAARVGGPAGEPEGFLYIVLAGEQYDSVAGMLAGSHVLRLGLSALVVSLIVALLAGLVWFHFITRRLRRLAAAVEAFRRSDFTQPVTEGKEQAEGSGDEIERLDSAFRRMARRIAQQVGQLKQEDASRRELVANVSHDLRTPLATLQGYLDTLLLKDGSLSREQQRQYLETAARHGERLGKLVAELFELATLEALEARPAREVFSLPELVQDVVQEFRLQAERRQVRLEARLGDGLPFVSADIRMIERVLENLIDNALRHTESGGSVTVLVEAEGARVTVSVADTGCGIPAEEISRVFDRFHRVRTATVRQDGGAGLGLAIAKRVLDLHDRAIDVESELGVGTTFRFSLTVHPG